MRPTATTYDAVVAHTRTEPLVNRFRYRTRTWLVDLDDLPALPHGLRWLARFDAADHVGTAGRSLRQNVDGVLAAHGIDLSGGRVLMLANARALGHVFNPLSVHWCYAVDGSLAAVVAEVHNTYGDRHAYLLATDGDPGTRTVDEVGKELYVSPFNAVDGRYRISVSAPDERLSLSVTLHREGHPPFVATLTGHRRRPSSVLAAALATAVTPLRVTALIRWQGVRLYLRGLRVEPRPVHPPQHLPQRQDQHRSQPQARSAAVTASPSTEQVSR